MPKEYHIYIVKDILFEQAFIFEVERHKTDDFIRITELWVVTEPKLQQEIKTRLKFEEIVHNIGQNVGGNITDENLLTMLDMLRDIIPHEKQLQIKLDLVKKDIDKSDSMAEKILKANDYAEAIINETHDISKIVNSLIDDGEK